MVLLWGAELALSWPSRSQCPFIAGVRPFLPLPLPRRPDSCLSAVYAAIPLRLLQIAFVCNQGKSVLFVAKRRIDSTVDQFKCHGFETSSQKTAKQLASHIVSTCNSVFRKLRRTRKHIRKRTEKEGKAPPVTSTNAVASSEEGERTLCQRADLSKPHPPRARAASDLPIPINPSSDSLHNFATLNCVVSSLSGENQGAVPCPSLIPC